MTEGPGFYRFRLAEEETLIKPKNGYCINCDNRHGCKTKTPPCITGMEKDGIAGMSGKAYLRERDRIKECGECPFFRSCWNSEDYHRLVK